MTDLVYTSILSLIDCYKYWLMVDGNPFFWSPPHHVALAWFRDVVIEKKSTKGEVN